MRKGWLFANRTQWLRGALGILLSLALAACAHNDQLVPVSGAATGSVQKPVGESSGVRMVANARAWDGDPPTLSQYVLPIWIQIENHSGKQLSLRYNAFRMEAPADNPAMLRAVPPSQVKGNAIIPASAVPPEFRPEDPWLGTWLEPDFDRYLASVYWQERLPTRQMLRLAIREGVVPDGRKIAGFVYFEKTRQDLAALTLSADLVDATTNQPFGRIQIPLALESGN